MRRKLSGRTKPIHRKVLEDNLLMSSLPQMGRKSGGKGKGRRAKYERRGKKEQGKGNREQGAENGEVQTFKIQSPRGGRLRRALLPSGKRGVWALIAHIVCPR